MKAAFKLIGMTIVSFTFSLPMLAQNKKGVGMSLWQQTKLGVPASSNKLGYNKINKSIAAKKVNIFGPAWYYTWTPMPLSVSPGSKINFYPMIEQHSSDPTKKLYYDLGKSQTFYNQLQKVNTKTPYKYLLLMNEPDNNIASKGGLSAQSAAKITNYNINNLKKLHPKTKVLAPVMAQHEQVLDRTWFNKKPTDYCQNNDIGYERIRDWLDKYFYCLTSMSKQELSPYNKPVIPFHLYPDPFVNLKLNKRNKNFLYKGHYMRSRLINEMADYFTQVLHDLKRKYDGKILLTEFGIADWAMLFPNLDPDNKKPTYNRIPREFVLEVYKKVLPELSERDYIDGYALFTNWIGTHSGALNTSAAFKTRYPKSNNANDVNSSLLTDVGKLYAVHKDSDYKCKKGEINYKGRYIEYLSKECGTPAKFGYNSRDRNGWYWYAKAKQYRRNLSKTQAGIFEDHYKVKDCTHVRFRYHFSSDENYIREFVSPACPGYSGLNSSKWKVNSWYKGTKGKMRRYNIKSERVGVLEFTWR